MMNTKQYFCAVGLQWWKYAKPNNTLKAFRNACALTVSQNKGTECKQDLLQVGGKWPHFLTAWLIVLLILTDTQYSKSRLSACQTKVFRLARWSHLLLDATPIIYAITGWWALFKNSFHNCCFVFEMEKTLLFDEITVYLSHTPGSELSMKNREQRHTECWLFLDFYLPPNSALMESFKDGWNGLQWLIQLRQSNDD